MTACKRIYEAHSITGHRSQYLTAALLIVYLRTHYPWAWQRNGKDMLLRHLRNMDKRNAA